MKNTIEKDSTGFTQISNQLANSKTISSKAKGIYLFMFSKPDNWTFTINSMSKQLKEGRESIMSGLQELKKTGWIKHTKHSDGTGTYSVLTYPKSENPDLGFPTVGKPDCINNKDLISNKEHIEDKKQEQVCEDVKPVDVITFYRRTISNKNQKVQESTSYKLLINNKHDMPLILKGLQNYPMPSEEKYITPLSKFIRDKIYLDFQEKEQSSRSMGGYTF